MDWGAFGAGALIGAIGGGLGALIGIFIARAFRDAPASKILTIALPALGAIIGFSAARPLMSYFENGAASRGVSREVIDIAVAELREDPVMAALLEREPALEREFRAMTREALLDGLEAEAAEEAGFDWGMAVVDERLMHYIQRARDEDIIEYFKVSVATADWLAETDPGYCYNHFMTPERLAGISEDETKAKLGADLFRREKNASVNVILNATPEMPEYDVSAAEAAVKDAGDLLIELLGEEDIGLISGGQRPANSDEARAACNALARMYEDLIAAENAADALRHLMVLSDYEE